VTIPNSVTSIGWNAFENCTGLISATIGNSVTSIGNFAFQGCTGLTSLTIPDSVTSIGFSSFEGCTGLTSITIPDSATNIYDRAFYGCTGLTSITIGNSVTSIGAYAFENCTALENVYYKGFYRDRFEKISFGQYNTLLTDATWHYTFCDESQHEYSINSNLTCEICGNSKKPNAPTIISQTSDSVTILLVEGCEYSIDGTNWQTSNIFESLLPNTPYTFYQRIKESNIALTSEKSDGTKVSLKAIQTLVPSAPIISSYNDTTVTLTPITNGEYSKDNNVWQKSNVFTGLSAGTEYTFYQRYAETDTHKVGDSSVGVKITTDKSKQTLIPNAPVLQSRTTSSITLVAVEGCEYSKDGIIWQDSNVFSDLDCGTNYSFYLRYKETNTMYAGKISAPLVTRTNKENQSAPNAPILSSKTFNSIVLTAVDGCEYSRDGINWQTSNVFVDLEPETNYMLYQRKAETDRYEASAPSTTLIVKTSEAPECYYNSSLHQYDDNADTDCNVCGQIRELLKNGWVYENGKWAYYVDDVKATNCWKLDSVGWCYLGSDGYMRTNSWIMDSQGWCYVGADGYCLTNAWMLDSVGWCYLNAEGRMATNSWILDSVGWCYVGADGYCVTNAWMKDSVGWCYLDAEGRMATNRWVMDSVGWCYVGADGYAVTNCWKQDSVGWCYLNSEGSMTKSAWVLDGGVWYYLDANGYMVTGWQYIGGTWYNFASSGAWIG
ncbi:MAG: leucine-rich repeat protein, partial [Clostridia bacterium]|nr:leucine-rich repeat protein [Clostridia bacterium]